jgi:peptidoglycan/xylan/chitin deacetylase (PgdA/CDA1 family)
MPYFSEKLNWLKENITSFLFTKIPSSSLLKLKNKFIILCYHRIGNKSGSNCLISSLINGTQEEFEKEIIFLKKYFNIISLDYLVERIDNKEPLPINSLLITFDDGYNDNYINAFPILKKYRVPAAVFLTTDFIDNDKDLIWTDKVAYIIKETEKGSVNISGLGTHSLTNRYRKDKAKIAIIEYLKSIDDSEKNKIIDLLSKDLKVYLGSKISEKLYLSSKEILEMAKDGISFGSHGCSHSILTKISLRQAQDEIVKSKMKIEELIGKEVTFFAYPNGTYLDFNNEIIEILKKAGYEAAFTTIPGGNRHSDSQDIFSLKRISAGQSLRDLKKNLFLYA